MGHIFLLGYREAVNDGPLSLHDIQVGKIIVVDHLVESIPVPEMFFSSRRVAFSPHRYSSLVSYVNNRISIILSKPIAEIAREIDS
jgi:hypothetical protein